jgi:hypothetical protein
MARDERTTLLALLRYQRGSFVGKVIGLDDDAARRALVGSGTTLLWLTKHVTRAEVIWVLRRFSGADVEIPDDTVYPEDTLTSAVESYRAAWTRVDDVVHGASLEEVCRGVGGEPAINLRWVLMQTAGGDGSARRPRRILRELIDGATGR